MRYTTIIKAIDPITGEIKTWVGPVIESISLSHAADYCRKNGLGYCQVIGELIAEVPSIGLRPDMKKLVDFELIRMN